MHFIESKAGGHKWHKTNLITIASKKGGYDEYVCKGCGLKAISRHLGTMQIDGRHSLEQVRNCAGADGSTIPKRIKITFCTAKGRAFVNLIPGSEHEVVTPPSGYKNDQTGVWVMGVGEPVKVLTNEFTKLS